MIGADTNILLRLVLRDDPRQLELVVARLRRAMSDREDVWIGPVVLAELVWTLARSLKVPRPETARMVRSLLDARPFVLFDDNVVERAIAMFEREPFGFSDAMILAMNEAAGCASTLTFDEDALKISHYVRPTD